MYYHIVGRSKDADGLYITNFRIVVHTPAGNPEDTALMHSMLEPECHEPTMETTITDYKGGLASTTETDVMTCISKEPILDTGDLIKVNP